MDLIEETGIIFEAGKPLRASDLNVLNNTINKLVRTVNTLLMGFCDVNQEAANKDTVFTLQQAINTIGVYRRSIGVKIRFKSVEGFVEYSYTGANVSDLEWNNLDNWAKGPDIVDGGTW